MRLLTMVHISDLHLGRTGKSDLMPGHLSYGPSGSILMAC